MVYLMYQNKNGGIRMYIDRPALKRQAKNLISSSKPQPIVV